MQSPETCGPPFPPSPGPTTIGKGEIHGVSSKTGGWKTGYSCFNAAFSFFLSSSCWPCFISSFPFPPISSIQPEGYSLVFFKPPSSTPKERRPSIPGSLSGCPSCLPCPSLGVAPDIRECKVTASKLLLDQFLFRHMLFCPQMPRGSFPPPLEQVGRQVNPYYFHGPSMPSWPSPLTFSQNA